MISIAEVLVSILLLPVFLVLTHSGCLVSPHGLLPLTANYLKKFLEK